ncbi:MAG: pyridoxamine 5'-phosphate oxidase family protein [Bryobacteraceae bacterium]|nr:pyridoxamine 5'-phosphate oxidase family protein [Bryobacteraceae bacterium]
MARNFGALVFTPLVKALQEKYGSRRQYAHMEAGVPTPDRLSPGESAFIAERDSFYMATVGTTGWPYVQHRGGPKGFVKVIDDRTIAFADFRGNRQYISTGNLANDDRVALIMVDYAGQTRLKILGHAQIVEGEVGREWVERLREPGSNDVIERVYLIRVEGFDWNCPQHITPRFTEEQIREALIPFERRLDVLTRENEKLRNRVNPEGDGP